MVSTLQHSRPMESRLAAAGLRASGVVGAVGIGFLFAMFAAFAAGARPTGMTLGWVNDVTGVITLPLAVPGMFVLHALIRPRAGAAGDVLLIIGVGSCGVISVLQVLLVTRVLTFEEQIGPVSLAFLVLGAWFVVTGRIAARSGVLPGGTRTGVLAASYVGYPVWAFRVARAIEAAAATPGSPTGAGD